MKFATQIAKLMFAICLAALFASPAVAQYSATNLVANTNALTPMHLDSNLVNGWGLASSPTSPLWVSDQNSSQATVYMANGTVIPLVVEIPCEVDGTITAPCPYPAKGELFEPLAGKAHLFGPTGVVFNSASPTSGAFTIPGSMHQAAIILATLDGLIVGWSEQVNKTQGVVVGNRSTNGASYSGLAIGQMGDDTFLFAANSVPGGKVDVFDSRFNYVNSFSADSEASSNFVPYGIQTIGNKLYVTYFNPTGAGGILDVCDLSGSAAVPQCHQLYASLAHLPPKVPPAAASGMSSTNPVNIPTVLNGPWGIALAPPTFGTLGGKLLVGNVTDGRIHAFDPQTGALLGTLTLSNGQPFEIPGLWGLEFSQQAVAVDATSSTLFFTAGPAPANNPNLLFSEGLFGMITPSKPPIVTPQAH